MLSITNAAGQTVDLSGVLASGFFRNVEASGLTGAQYLNRLEPTGPNQATVFEQLATSMGFVGGSNDTFGIRPSTIDAILNPKHSQSEIQAGAITRDADLGPRVFFPVYALSVMEAALRDDRSSILQAYNAMVSVRDTIPGYSWERPIIDFTEAEKPRTRYVAQLSEPTVMVTAKLSSKTAKLLGSAIGVEYSDQVAKAMGIDFLMKGFARRAEQESIDRVYDKVFSFLNGDPDVEMVSLATAGLIKKANTFDAGITQAGVLSQEAWVRWLVKDSKKRTINYVVTDLAGAFAIQNRTGRPTVQTDNATSKRIDVLENILNPLWPEKINYFIIEDDRWPAGLILGLDTRYAVHHVTSTALNYSGAEEWAIRRSTKLRFDIGDYAARLYDEAWSGLSLTL